MFTESKPKSFETFTDKIDRDLHNITRNVFKSIKHILRCPYFVNIILYNLVFYFNYNNNLNYINHIYK